MNSLEEKYWKRAKVYVGMLRVVPFLRMVAVCNNLAFGKVSEKSDIDLFIVAKGGRLFIVRFFVTLILHLMGVRRHGKKVAGRFCLSFFIDDSALDLSSLAIEKDIYLAYWVKSVVPLLDDGVHLEFLSQNRWVEEYFERDESFDSDVACLGGGDFAAKFFEMVFGGRVGDFIEKWLKNWQMRRALKKAKNAGGEASLVVKEHVLKFHNIDRRREYRNRWFQTYGESTKLSREKFIRLRLGP